MTMAKPSPKYLIVETKGNDYKKGDGYNYVDNAKEGHFGKGGNYAKIDDYIIGGYDAGKKKIIKSTCSNGAIQI